MSDDGKVIDIYEWRRPWKRGEFMGCAIPAEPATETEKDEWSRLTKAVREWKKPQS